MRFDFIKVVLSIRSQELLPPHACPRGLGASIVAVWTRPEKGDVAADSALDGDPKRSTQHFILTGKDGVFSDKSRISPRFHCGGKNGVVGSLAARGVAEGNRAFGKPSSIYLQVAPHGGFALCHGVARG